MNKLIPALLLATGLAAAPAQAAETIFTWQATALDARSGAPIEGVQFNWTFVDKTITKTSTDTCTSNNLGICSVRLSAKKGPAGASVFGQATAAMDGYEPEIDYQWREDGNLKFLVAKLTPAAARPAAGAGDSADLKTLRSQLSAAIDRSGIQCMSKVQCDLMFTLAETYVAKSADMKVESVTPTTISTFSPNRPGAIGMTILRMRGQGDTSVISVSTSCDDDGDSVSKACLQRQLRIVKGFKGFMESALMKT
ncbi:hypothetical protein [Massilia sp. CF038]|uniref:hypothetical protein n=1 Tax=Massilia sp. CF038 TaxID=1881045 RepID=UPI00090ECD8B|nr:hypothetical protein [Massilia sp. CF038]SHG58122.1 hypothetical protein SAMN05428948_1128 [Massilia sp. CF038]